jgi:hypothetical protein
MLEKAALSIQKTFRGWKKRKEFLKLRRNVIKIQVSLHNKTCAQDHCKYYFVWSIKS